MLKNSLNWKRGHASKEDFNYLKFKDIQDSRALLFHLAQTVGKNSTKLSLTPFLDKNNYLCVGGHLKHANMPTNSKSQTILSKDHYLSCLLIKEIHKQNAHLGREHTLSLLRKHFWIVACSGLIKKVLSDCMYCH